VRCADPRDCDFGCAETPAQHVLQSYVVCAPVAVIGEVDKRTSPPAARADGWVVKVLVHPDTVTSSNCSPETGVLCPASCMVTRVGVLKSSVLPAVLGACVLPLPLGMWPRWLRLMRWSPPCVPSQMQSWQSRRCGSGQHWRGTGTGATAGEQPLYRLSLGGPLHVYRHVLNHVAVAVLGHRVVNNGRGCCRAAAAAWHRRLPTGWCLSAQAQQQTHPAETCTAVDPGVCECVVGVWLLQWNYLNSGQQSWAVAQAGSGPNSRGASRNLSTAADNQGATSVRGVCQFGFSGGFWGKLVASGLLSLMSDTLRMLGCHSIAAAEATL
jgi:hypothetical protein